MSWKVNSISCLRFKLYQLIFSRFKVAPGLLAGNTIIIKPSPVTPLATLKFVELAQQVLPPGVLSVVSGDDNLYAPPSVQRLSLNI